jgi:two-component system, NtrC family, response regulator AtoC
MSARLLVVDDDPEVIDIVRSAFEGRDIAVQGASSSEEALNRMSRELPDLVLLDVRLPTMNGLEMCRLLKDRGVDVPVILISAYTSMQLTIQAMQEGAFDYLDKPLRPKSLVALVERALETRETAEGDEVEVLSSDASDGSREPWELVGKSETMLEVYKTIGRVARTNATVLITGESGTGKEVVARAIHEKGPRAEEPFEAVNCAAIPDNLLEGELFGYEKGAFTGATRERAGKFEIAGRGSLFLDEVGDLPPSLQPKLLRALEEREVDRLGGSKKVPVEARILAATNQNLESAVEAGSFREDLYFRLAVVNIRVPPLRDRKGDIRRLVDHFVASLAPEVGRRLERVASDTYRRLEEYSWPGNVRELRNVVERSLILGSGPVLRPRDLPPLEENSAARPALELAALVRQGMGLDELERRYIDLVLEETEGNLTKAAEILGIHRSTLHRKVRRFEKESA